MDSLTGLDASICAIPFAEIYIDNCPLDFGTVCSPEDWGSDALEENHETELDAEGAAGGINLQAGSSVLVIKGTVPRDFRLLVFFMNQFPPSP